MNIHHIARTILATKPKAVSQEFSVSIQVRKEYTVSVKAKSPQEAIDKAYAMQSTEIEATGRLMDVTTDHAAIEDFDRLAARAKPKKGYLGRNSSAQKFASYQDELEDELAQPIARKTFVDEMSAEKWMTENCLNNGFYRKVNGKWVVFEYVWQAKPKNRLAARAKPKKGPANPTKRICQAQVQAWCNVEIASEEEEDAIATAQDLFSGEGISIYDEAHVVLGEYYSGGDIRSAQVEAWCQVEFLLPHGANPNAVAIAKAQDLYGQVEIFDDAHVVLHES